MIGRTISHYKIISKLGEGGMGVVYKAEDTKLDRLVALKFLPASLATQDAAKERFIQEAKAASSLEHPNICVVHDIAETDDGQMFIAMPYYDGETLQERIASGPLEIEEAIDAVTQLASGLAKAHDQGIVHRDIKPGNILLTKDGHVKILDFGLAKLAAQVQLTKSGTTVGTAAYMSPEQACGETVDHRADIWSLGVVLYEMLTGHSPFSADYEQAAIYRIIHENPEPVSALRTGVPVALERIVGKCLEKKPEDRYQHIDDVLTDLRRVHEAPPSEPKKRLIRFGLPASVVAIAVLLFLIVNPFHIEFKKGQPVEAIGNTIGVIGFENLSDPEDREHLGRMLMGLIITDLTESGGLTVASTSKVLAAYKDAGGKIEGRFDGSLAAETARLAGARTMLTGQVIQSRGRLLLTAELVDVGTGNTLGSLKREASSSTELFALAGAIAADVRDRLDLPEQGRRSFDLARSLTDSPEAYRQFIVGEVAVHQRDWGEAVERFSLAAKHDSTFALAWYWLSIAYDWVGNHEAGLAAIDRSLEYLDKLPPRWQVMCRAKKDYEEGNADAAYTALNDLITTATDMPDAYYYLGEILMHYSRYIDAQKAKTYFERALEIDPTFKVVFEHLIEDYLLATDVAAAELLLNRHRDDRHNVIAARIQILMFQERFDEVIALLGADTKEALLGSGDWRYLALALGYRGEWNRAQDLAEEAVRAAVQAGVGVVSSHTIWHRGSIHCARGRLRAAIADYREAADQLATERRSYLIVANIENAYHLDRADVLVLTGDSEGALDALREAKNNDRFDPRPYAWKGLIFLDAGRREEAERELSDLKAMEAESFSPWTEYWLHILEAAMHSADGRLDRALYELERASALRSRRCVNDRGDVELILRGRVLEAGGDRAGAIAAYRNALKPPLWGMWSPLMTSVHYELGRLLEEEGNVAAAREHYRTYVDRWGDADMPVPNVETAQERLHALGAQ